MKRNPFFDNAKFLLIFLVVLGHMLSIGNSNYKLNHAATEWIFSFHMPLFVFISGYFTKIKDKNKYLIGILKFTETFVVFTLIHTLIEYLQGKPTSDYLFSTYPKWTLWYLLSIIWWRLILYYTPSSIHNNHKLLIFISIILSLVMGWIPVDSQFSFQRTFAFLPFFMVGYVIGKNNLDIIAKNNNILKISFLVSIGIFFFIIPISFFSVLFQDRSFIHDTSASPILSFVFRVGWLFFASCMSYCFLSLVPRKEYRWTHFGQLTLFIYLYHSVILSWRFIIRDEIHLPTNIFFCILYTAVVLGFIWIMSKVKFFHWLLNPISSTIKQFKSWQERKCL